jgi:hypothetical protein
LLALAVIEHSCPGATEERLRQLPSLMTILDDLLRHKKLTIEKRFNWVWKSRKSKTVGLFPTFANILEFVLG